MNDPLTIAGITFPDTETAVAYFDEQFDADEYDAAFPAGFSESLAWLRFNHRDLSDDDITTLAHAVHAHATRPDQDIPSWKTLRTLVKGQPIAMPRTSPAWESEHDHLATLPPALHPTTAPTSILARFARKLAAR